MTGEARGLTSEKIDELLIVIRSQLLQSARAPDSGPLRWLTLKGRPISAGQPAPRGGIRVLPVKPGTGVLPLRSGQHQVEVVHVELRRNGHRIDFRTSSVALARALDPQLALAPSLGAPGSEDLTFHLCASVQALPTSLKIVSTSAEGRYLDSLRELALVSAPGSGDRKRDWGKDIECVQSLPLRVVADLVDRNHPLLANRAVLGRLGGQLSVEALSQVAMTIAVGAPSKLGKGGVLRGFQVHATVLRSHVGGPPALGQNDSEAAQIVRQELLSASQVWGQCGLTIGPVERVAVEIVDPPKGALFTVGCDTGLPASGGELRFLAGERRIMIRTHAGQSPRSVASRVAARLRSHGLTVRIYGNPRVESRPLPSFDLEVRDRQGRLVKLAPLSNSALSSDPTMPVCLARLDVSDGLSHFVDENAAAGTMEERVLLRLLGDSDPSTIDIFFVPTFGGSGRIGESFIFSPGASIFNAIVLDRSGVRASARSSTLAHELGHILLALPGHPDDYGVDTPTSLMDADAADPTVYGPRRLSLSDCQRAIRQSGGASDFPLLTPFTN